ncbi:MAG: efflux RND transporter periplasmic adaptor subunit [Pseudomonadota bacterium]
MSIRLIISAIIITLFLASGSALAQTASPDQTLEEVRGVVKAEQEAVISADLLARVAKTPVRTGEAFQKGDLLISFDCDAPKAEAQAAGAAYRAAKARHESNLEMKTNGAIGQFEVDLSQAEMEQARARARAMSARIKSCDIRAPYNGFVAELAVNAHETPGGNASLMKIVGSETLELRLIVPSNWLLWLKPEVPFSFTIDETGTRHKAKVTRIGAEVDAVSRTVPIIAHFDETPGFVLPGMSGSAEFNRAMR